MIFSRNRKSRPTSNIPELEAYFYRCTREDRTDRARAIIFAQGRTGSTLLESLLCSIGHFSRNGELLNTSHYRETLFPLQYIRGMARKNAEENFIFHLKIYHLTEDRSRPVDPVWFVKMLFEEGWKIIYLSRRNKLKHALSNAAAKARQSYHKFGEDEKSSQLIVDCDKLVMRVRRRFQREELEKEVLSRVRYLELTYENDLENPEVHQETADKVLDYLSLECRKVSTKHKKINAQPLPELIANYDEFLSCVRERGWQGFL